jgi:hypothetical protein
MVVKNGSNGKSAWGARGARPTPIIALYSDKPLVCNTAEFLSSDYPLDPYIHLEW